MNMNILKTNKTISKEAESLYSEHKDVSTRIDNTLGYIDSAQKMVESMKDKDGNIDSGYQYSMDLDISMSKGDVKMLEKTSEQNLSAAERHLVDNPRLFSVAVKAAMRDGIKINTR